LAASPQPCCKASWQARVSPPFYAQCFPTLQAALQSVHEVLGSLKRSGSLGEVRDRLVSFEERQSAVRKHMFDKMEARYAD
jgi:hypothetical protein